MKNNEWLVKRFNEDIAFAIIYHTIDQHPDTYKSRLNGTPASVSSLFVWANTPEGHDYWKEIQLIEEIFKL